MRHLSDRILATVSNISSMRLITTNHNKQAGWIHLRDAQIFEEAIKLSTQSKLRLAARSTNNAETE